MLIDSKDIIEAAVVCRAKTRDPKGQLRLLLAWVAMIEATGYDTIKDRGYVPEEIIYLKQVWKQHVEEWKKRIKKPAPEQRAGLPTSVGRRLPKKYNTKKENS